LIIVLYIGGARIHKSSCSPLDGHKVSKVDLSEGSADKPNFSPFTPNSLEHLKYELDRNKQNLREVEDVCNDPRTRDDVKERLIDERKYFLDQQRKHTTAILDMASKVDLNDVDADKLSKEVGKLKDDVERLYEDCESVKHRRLEQNQTDDSINSRDGEA
jgi:DNA-binding transcriptional regulator GbsR (MarR family)